MPSLSEEALTNSKTVKTVVMDRLNLLKEKGVSIADVCKISGCHPKVVMYKWIGTSIRNDPDNIMTEKHYIKFLNTIGVKIAVSFITSPNDKIDELITKINEQKEKLTTKAK